MGSHCTGNLIDYSQKIISIFPVLFFSLFFFLFSTRHPAFKSQEHRFPTIYFKPVSWITFYLLLSILTKNLSFLCGCHGKARLLLVIIRKYTSVALFMRIHEHVYRKPFILSAFHRTHLNFWFIEDIEISMTTGFFTQNWVEWNLKCNPLYNFMAVTKHRSEVIFLLIQKVS